MKKGKFMLAALLGLYTSTSFTMADPSLVGGYYQIGTYEDLVWFRDYVNSTDIKAKAELTADITVPEDEVWEQVANTKYPAIGGKTGYNGTFDGKGYSIYNLQIEGQINSQIGLFGSLRSDAKIKNLNIVNAKYGEKTSSTNNLAGGITSANNGGTISNCSFSGSIKSQQEDNGVAGGICGNLYGGSIEHCYTSGSFNGSLICGGIAGNVTNGKISNSYTTASLTSDADIYPIAFATSANISNCFYSSKTTDNSGATSEEDFNNGRVAYLLNQGNTEPFLQKIGTEKYPTFKGNSIVYQYKSCAYKGNNPADRIYKYTNDASMKDVDQKHDLHYHAAVEPAACGETGNLAYWTCENESDIYYKNAEATEKYENKKATEIKRTHEWTEHSANDATCTKDGNVHYFSCKYEPGVYYKNNDGKEKLDEVIIPATGHDLEKHVMSANICTKEGESSEFIYYTCKNNKNEFFKEDGLTLIENPEEAIYATTGHDWGEWVYKNTTDNVDTYIRICKNNADHTETATVPHAWGEAELLSSEPAKDTYKHTCSSKYGEHSENYDVEFMTEEATYYSQITGERDTTLRANTKFIPVDTKNDLLFAGEESTISGNNVVKGETCKKLVFKDKVNFRIPQNFTAKELVYDRKNSLAYQTFILPYDVPTSEFNGGVYEFRRYDSNARTIWFYSVEGIAQAGTPYILYRKTVAEETNLHANLKNIKLDASEWDNGIRSIANNKCFFRGTYEDIQRPIDSKYESVYIFSQNKFCLATGVAEIPGYRGYVQLEKPTASPSLGIMFDDQLTGVATIDADGNLSVGNVDVYDMNGRLVRKNVESATCLQGLKPGVYVVNGEKFVKTDKE